MQLTKKSTQTIHALYEIEHQKIKQETAFAHQQEELQLKIKELIEENKVLLEQQVSKPSEPELSLKSELEKERLLNQALQRENQDLKRILMIPKDMPNNWTELLNIFMKDRKKPT
ncbi:MAG: hypothetical protein HWD61_11760 [Parachlamydiaceae bacterium]|nr:MAG: hypothetical protein HWD61_11760 [Parachlamydiaceae bacterium]